MTASRCPLCGAAGSACGPSHPTTPIDSPTLRKKGPDMAKLSNYDTVVNGMPTTLRLTEEDAERRGLLGPAVVIDADGVEHTGVLPLSSATSPAPAPDEVASPTDAPVAVNAPPSHEVIDPAPAVEPTTAPAAEGKRPTGRAGK